MTKAVLVCCSLDAEPSLAGALVELDRAGVHVEVVSGVDEDFLPFGRALDRLDEPGIAVLLLDANLTAMAIRRLEGVFSARSKPGHELVRLSLDPTAPPQAVARAILEAARGRPAHGSDGPHREPRDTIRSPPSSPHPQGGPATSANDATSGRTAPPAGAGRPVPPSASPPVPEAPAAPAPGIPFPKAVAPHSTPRPSSPGAPDGGPATSGVLPSPSPLRRRRSQGLVFALAAASGLVLTAAALRLLRNRRSPTPPAATARAPAEPTVAPAASPPAGGPSPGGADEAPAPPQVSAVPRAGAPPESTRGAEPGVPSNDSRRFSEPETAGFDDPPPRDDFETREAVVIARALAKGRLRAINRLVLGVADPSPRTFEEAAAACRNAVVAGVGNFHLPSRSELRALRRARLLPSGRYWTRARDEDDRRLILDTSKLGFDAADPAAPVAGIACVRRLPGP